jgi:hypothetical protein
MSKSPNLDGVGEVEEEIVQQVVGRTRVRNLVTVKFSQANLEVMGTPPNSSLQERHNREGHAAEEHRASTRTRGRDGGRVAALHLGSQRSTGSPRAAFLVHPVGRHRHGEQVFRVQVREESLFDISAGRHGLVAGTW